MGLQRDSYTVYVTSVDPEAEPQEYVATINHQDMIRGEAALLQGPGNTLNQALALTTAWCWASLMRQGDYAGAWQTFRDTDCQGIEKADPVEVDPTMRATTDTSP